MLLSWNSPLVDKLTVGVSRIGPRKSNPSAQRVGTRNWVGPTCASDSESKMDQAVRQDELWLAPNETRSRNQAGSSFGATGPKRSRGALLDSEADALLAEVLLGRVSPARGRCAHLDVERLFERACFHGVASIIYERLKNAGTLVAPVAGRFRQEAMARAMWELRHRNLLVSLIDEFRKRNVEPVCFKGTALAYGLYDKAHHRSRGDTDLIVCPLDLAAAREVFLSLGFRRQNSLPGECVHAQENWLWRGPEGAGHAVDLHWRINNARALGDLFTYDDLRASATVLPDLKGLLIADRVTSLVIAAFHRAVHQYDLHMAPSGGWHSGERLCWLYDIHLLVQSFAPQEWRRALELAQSKGLESTFVRSVQLSQEWFGTTVPTGCLSTRCAQGAADRYLQRSPLQRELSQAFGWGAARSLRHVREVLLPPADYMRAKYPAARWGWLPWLYVRRWAEGVAKRAGSAHT